MMKLKKKEFEDLKQGSMIVSEYVTSFTQLSRYGPDDVDTDEKKQDWVKADVHRMLMVHHQDVSVEMSTHL
jgi:hypothetical protein